MYVTPNCCTFFWNQGISVVSLQKPDMGPGPQNLGVIEVIFDVSIALIVIVIITATLLFFHYFCYYCQSYHELLLFLCYLDLLVERSSPSVGSYRCHSASRSAEACILATSSGYPEGPDTLQLSN